MASAGSWLGYFCETLILDVVDFVHGKVSNIHVLSVPPRIAQELAISVNVAMRIFTGTPPDPGREARVGPQHGGEAALLYKLVIADMVLVLGLLGLGEQVELRAVRLLQGVQIEQDAQEVLALQSLTRS